MILTAFEKMHLLIIILITWYGFNGSCLIAHRKPWPAQIKERAAWFKFFRSFCLVLYCYVIYPAKLENLYPARLQIFLQETTRKYLRPLNHVMPPPFTSSSHPSAPLLRRFATMRMTLGRMTKVVATTTTQSVKGKGCIILLLTISRQL